MLELLCTARSVCGSAAALPHYITASNRAAAAAAAAAAARVAPGVRDAALAAAVESRVRQQHHHPSAAAVASPAATAAYDRATDPAASGSAWFAGVFGNSTVLQRGPQRAAVYGGLNVSDAADSGVGTAVVQVTVTDDSGAVPPYTVAATVTSEPDSSSSSSSSWRAQLRPHGAGGSFSISAACLSGCGVDSAPSRIGDVTFGDVWLCTGQSNAWLPMRFSLAHNASLAALRRNSSSSSSSSSNNSSGSSGGDHSLIRTLQIPNVARFDAGSPDAGPDPAPGSTGPWWVLPRGVDGPGGFSWRRGWERASAGSLEMFSAACWHFAEALVDAAAARGEPPVPLGLVGSYWGGTMIEMWMPNATVGSCRNASGRAWAPSQMQRWDIAAGALFNGMVAPLVNTSITGAIWYQGENNVFECEPPPDGAGVGWNPHACGATAAAGYGCQLSTMVRAWRDLWRASNGAHDDDFAVGVVQLAGGTSEGHAENMGAFRLAQTANYGFLPNAAMPRTFLAQAYDAGEPWQDESSKCAATTRGGSSAAGAFGAGASPPWACVPSAGDGTSAFTPMFMGSIHPRPKRVVGERLAAAARAVVYGDEAQIYTGPVLAGCKVVHAAHHSPFSSSVWIDISFDASLLRGDAVVAWHAEQGGANALSWTGSSGQFFAPGEYDSPMEVQVNNGSWVGVQILATADRENIDPAALVAGTATLPPNYNVVTVSAGIDASANITGIRWAWGDNPCCPRLSRSMVPCPVNSCGIGTVNSSLPAVPFVARIVGGRCKCLPPQKCDSAS